MPMTSRPFDDPCTERMLRFLKSIGVVARIQPVAETSLLPGVDVRHGAMLVDPDRLAFPGDLLHEAGHIAVSAPEQRGTAAIQDDPGEEMAAIAWSYAAALAIGVDPRIVLHAGGYKGGGDAIADAFERGAYFGVPLLVWYGMAKPADEAGGYPAMLRWFR